MLRRPRLQGTAVQATGGGVAVSGPVVAGDAGVGEGSADVGP